MLYLQGSENMDYMNFAAFYDSLTQNVQYPQWAARLHHLIGCYSRTEGRILLDLACGSGSMSEEMAKLGYDVIGVDNSPAMLAAAMDKKFESGLPIQYLCQDMRKIDMFGTVDVTICTLDSLNHLPGLADVQQVFNRVSLFAQPGGLFLFDMNTLYKHREVLHDKVFLYDMEDVFCAWENHLLSNGATVEMQLTFFEKNGQCYERSDEFITETAYTAEEIRNALQTAGLEPVAEFDAERNLEKPEQLLPCCDTTERILFVARKPEMEVKV